MSLSQTVADWPGSTQFKVLVIAASAGGVEALGELLSALSADFRIPILIAQHLSPTFASRLDAVLGRCTALTVRWAEDSERPRPATIYVCPPNHHMALTVAGIMDVQRITSRSRFKPSADLLFESAVRAHGDATIGLVLSGVLNDGCDGLAAIKLAGGITFAQSELSAAFFDMPAAAIDVARAEIIASPFQMAGYLNFIQNAIELLRKRVRPRLSFADLSR